VGQSPEEIRQEIEGVRGNLGQTLDTIGDRVSPRGAVRRRTAGVRSRFNSVRYAVMGSPEEAGPGRGSQLASGVADRGQQLTGRAQDAVGTVAEGVRAAPETARQTAQGNPLAAGIVAFGAGLVAASLIPASEHERQAAASLKESAEPLREQAAQAGQQVKEQLAHSVQGATEQVKQTARQGVDETRQQAQGAAEEVRDQATSRGQDVAQEARQVREQKPRQEA
jgi:hypothetical protein